MLQSAYLSHTALRLLDMDKLAAPGSATAVKYTAEGLNFATRPTSSSSSQTVRIFVLHSLRSRLHESTVRA